MSEATPAVRVNTSSGEKKLSDEKLIAQAKIYHKNWKKLLLGFSSLTNIKFKTTMHIRGKGLVWFGFFV